MEVALSPLPEKVGPGFDPGLGIGIEDSLLSNSPLPPKMSYLGFKIAVVLPHKSVDTGIHNTGLCHKAYRNRFAK